MDLNQIILGYHSISRWKMPILNSCKNSIPKREPNHLAAGGYIKEAITEDNWMYYLNSARLTYVNEHGRSFMTAAWKPLAKLVRVVFLFEDTMEMDAEGVLMEVEYIARCVEKELDTFKEGEAPEEGSFSEFLDEGKLGLEGELSILRALEAKLEQELMEVAQ